MEPRTGWARVCTPNHRRRIIGFLVRRRPWHFDYQHVPSLIKTIEATCRHGELCNTSCTPGSTFGHFVKPRILTQGPARTPDRK